MNLVTVLKVSLVTLILAAISFAIYIAYGLTHKTTESTSSTTPTPQTTESASTSSTVAPTPQVTSSAESTSPVTSSITAPSTVPTVETTPQTTVSVSTGVEATPEPVNVQAEQYSVFVNTDYTGHGVAGGTPGSLDSCKASCDSTPGCNAFVIDQGATYCFLKDLPLDATPSYNTNWSTYYKGTPPTAGQASQA